VGGGLKNAMLGVGNVWNVFRDKSASKTQEKGDIVKKKEANGTGLRSGVEPGQNSKGEQAWSTIRKETRRERTCSRDSRSGRRVAGRKGGDAPVDLGKICKRKNPCPEGRTSVRRVLI